jgi:hypothetical protein
MLYQEKSGNPGAHMRHDIYFLAGIPAFAHNCEHTFDSVTPFSVPPRVTTCFNRGSSQTAEGVAFYLIIYTEKVKLFF